MAGHCRCCRMERSITPTPARPHQGGGGRSIGEREGWTQESTSGAFFYPRPPLQWGRVRVGGLRPKSRWPNRDDNSRAALPTTSPPPHPAPIKGAGEGVAASEKVGLGKALAGLSSIPAPSSVGAGL